MLVGPERERKPWLEASFRNTPFMYQGYAPYDNFDEYNLGWNRPIIYSRAPANVSIDVVPFFYFYSSLRVLED
ncbi:MAG: hypothetical protein CO029_03155 [Candidatus Magasanikbacteria bacterium CG_4_9_14_0_2_um_filter_41_10]|uniref:Uncharacterized protein n=1 Tax=Candidatus Magasanikbacteria bacterium CG_4_10_14_0_2_um_filter_41_31 TaxID=1974639 RepID=A0A2M7V695_9BACT|nr:MAG: hypothetical protein AUJ37_03220 [Candidatus Magasanikbacteria bacterium CG1_02_41_34]PIZ94085.1 MAG: hypothetical protein COX83_00180 [Candidatus Magasanikbacteria bacterium CG_4_10_14_0_2_um_filter_41_31]PJC53374.1 MAG: hypothetical protein CO029_03155 [Candidatus Magasanikbacteria bacterium CG_4_9_14_0_2_um_filter_41_10]